MTRLTRQNLPSLPPAIGRPGYDASGVSVGIVHLGIGAFHRAHQSVYTDDVLARDPSWGICGVSLRSADTRDALGPQDDLYTLKVQDGSGEQLRVIASVVETLVAPESPEAVLARMVDPATRIVSLTITEKGYCHNPATGMLDENHTDVLHDLKNPENPRSAIGFIVEALAQRRSANVPPFTLLSCDNLPSNGHVLKRVIVRFAQLRSKELGDFIRGVSVPSTMIDRIVPATTDADREAVAAALGVTDAWPVVTEPFSQWVIEDDFPLGRPAWDAAGAVFVTDVSVYENMKLRLLNGSHSTLAYLGVLAGAETVADAMALDGMQDLIEGLMRDEASPTLPVLSGFDLPAYRRDLIARFNNPALRHKTMQIAMDGSQKLPQRLLNTIRDRIATGQPYPAMALGVAAWIGYVSRRDQNGDIIKVNDPLADRIASSLQATTSPSERVDAILGLSDVFGQDLPHSATFRKRLVQYLSAIEIEGASRAVKSHRALFDL